MLIRKFDRDQLESEPHNVLFKDLYPWEAIDETPFGASLAVVEPGGKTMIHHHNPCETFLICQGKGTMTCNGESSSVSSGDVIYLPPQSEHFLANDSQTDPLMFLSVFWDGPEQPAVEAPAPRLYVPSPPTPNGGLHLGHLSGPYLLADVLKRADRQRGRQAGWMLVSDDHQSYTALRAHFEQTAVDQTARRYADEIVALLKSLDAAPDALVQPSQNPDYARAVLEALKGLKLASQERQGWYCGHCDSFLYDGYARGLCPDCESPCRGFLCETCCAPNHWDNLAEVHCLLCDQPAQRRSLRCQVFSLEPYRQALVEYHQQLKLPARLRALAHQFLALENLEVVAVHPGVWGLSPEPGQILSPWFELSLASPLLSAGHQTVNCFGADNAFLYLMLDPAVALALGQRPAAELHVNEYLTLDSEKMSTSRGHVLEAGPMLAEYGSDLVRLLLAGLRPEVSDSQCSAEMAENYLRQRVIGGWQDWLEGIGRRITTESGSKVPAAELEWGVEQEEFLEKLETLRARCQSAYQKGRLQQVAACLQELVEQSGLFAHSQQPLQGLPDRSVGLALELAAARLMAQLSAPLMPKFATQLWKHLGQRGPLDWPQSVQLLEPGQRVLAAAGLSARRYF
ncbi:class I tRNA ligase family protein [bacterium]|nr:class I tRNA ligase family protein [bacterium]